MHLCDMTPSYATANDVMWCDVIWCDVMDGDAMTDSTENAAPSKPPNRETRLLGISWYKFKTRFWLGARRRGSFSPAAAAHHQGRSQHMQKKIRELIYPGVYLSGVINSRNLGPKIFFHPHLDLPWWPIWICTEKFEILDLVDFGGIQFQWKLSHLLWQYALQSLHLRNPPNRKTQIPRYKVEWNRNLLLNLYRKIPRNLSLSIWWISGRSKFQGKLSWYCGCLPRAFAAWYT